MKGLLSALLALTLSLFPFSAIAVTPIYNEQTTAIQVTHDNPEFIIKLKSNPTTGYSWQLKQYDSHYIEAVKHDFEAPHSTLIGAGGYETWLFKAKSGNFLNSRIKFIYLRPWEKQKEVATEIEFSVTGV